MSNAKTGIGWTDATWNPTTGCTKVSAGCDHCYAETMARTKLREAYGKRLPVLDTDEARADPFAVRLWPERLVQPERWTDPRMIFVNSMSDLFHVDVPSDFVRQIFEVMIRVDRHIYQVLTKRPARMARWVKAYADLLPGGVAPGHIWMGTSVEDQANAFRARQLLEVPATTRFLSCEPLLGPLDLSRLGLWLCKHWNPSEGGDPNIPGRFRWERQALVHRDAPRLHWIITGGESGGGARPCNPDWVRSIRDQCAAAGVAFFHKQWGGRTPKAGGRELDGRTWDEFPEVIHA